jgi:glycosyltransferase involved in cell wall biosynthesis
VRVVNLPAGPARFVPKDDLPPFMPAFRDELIRFARRERIDYDVIHGNFWMSGWVATELKRQFGVPVVQLFHALGTTKRRHQREADTSPSDRIDVERDIVRSVDRVIATCPAEQADLMREYRAEPGRLEVIPLGVDLELFRPKDRRAARAQIGLGLRDDDFVVVYVGRVLPRKDIRNVISALAHLGKHGDEQCARIKLLIVGGESRLPDPATTPELGELQRLAEELGVADRVIFTGKRRQDELRDYYGAGDVMVTTPWYEPFGLTPLEAMACAKPVIGSDVGGLSFTIRHGETGLLVPPRSPEALGAAIRALLDDPDRRVTMGVAGRDRVERDFTWRSVAEHTASLYETIHRETAHVRAISSLLGLAELSGQTALAGD